MMNYDKIILELLSRVQVLEEQMADVKTELASRDDYEEDANEGDYGHGDITRSQARDKAIEIIQSKFPDYVVDKASRKEGSGIKVHKPDAKRPLIIKFYHSKSFEHRSGSYEHSWHVVRLNDVIGTIVDLCMFSYVDSHGNWNFFIYEPDEAELFEEVITSFLSVYVYRAILTSVASEFASRMLAMHNATENADELSDLLTLEYNKARQSSITTELLDITAGAEALKTL
mgnify:CR=1 FL=1